MKEQTQLSTEPLKTHIIVMTDGSYVAISESQSKVVIDRVGDESSATHIRINGMLISTKSISKVMAFTEYEDSQVRAGKVKCAKGHWHWVNDKDICPADRQTRNELWDQVVSAFGPEKMEKTAAVDFKEKSPILAKAYIEGRNEFRKRHGMPPVTKMEVPVWARSFA